MRFGVRNRTALRPVAVYASASLLALLAAAPANAGGLPSGGQVVAGQATISNAPGQVSITQAGGHAIINWQDFSIAAANGVKFNNGSGATLNRVTGGNLSQIDGVLKATGSVYLINPQGVVVGAGGKVITGGSFVASTRDVDNDAFMRGDNLHASGTSSGNVINQGKIVSRYGDTILIGKSVSNSGTIKAKNGTAGLAAGDDVVLRPMDGDARISISAGKGDVTNTGTISAAQAELNAAGGNVYAVAGNAGGISATGVKTVGGRIWLSGGDTTEVSGAVSAKNADGSGGTIIATAPTVTVDADAKISASGTTGGTVLIGGDEAGGSDPARKHVRETVVTARNTTMVHGAQVSADGSAGAGGAVVVWSDEHTVFDGLISARGAGQGAGGFAEVSSHDVLDFTGLSDLSAANGTSGTLLLDPSNLTINTGTTSASVTGAPNYVNSGNSASTLKISDLTAQLANNNVTVTSTGSITIQGTVSWASAHNLSLTAATSITLGAGGSGNNLTMNSPNAILSLTAGTTISWVSSAPNLKLAGLNIGGTTSASLTVSNFAGVLSGKNIGSLSFTSNTSYSVGTNGTVAGITTTGGLTLVNSGAGANITVNSPISSGSLYFYSSGGNGTVFGNASISTGLFTVDAIGWSQVSANLPAFSATGGIVMTEGGASFLRAAGGDGSTANPYLITDIYGLQGAGTVYGSFALANDIDAAPIASWNGGQGFVSGYLNNDLVFDGRNHTISNLTQNITNGSSSGLYGYVADGAVVKNLTLATPSITGNGTVGVVAAQNFGTISNVTVTGGTITGTGGSVGAVAGTNGGIEADYDPGCGCFFNVTVPGYIQNVTSSATVNAAGYADGGLVGSNYGSITGSVATGAVNGADGSDNANYAEQVGGLVGYNAGTIDTSSASGNVSGFDTVGGLVGASTSLGSITNSHASGTVTVPANPYPVNSGGLVGQNDGLIDTSYATGDVNGSADPSSGSTYLGGLAGVNRGTIKNSNASGDVTGQSYVGGLVGGNGGPDHYIQSTLGGTIQNSYATGAVTGISNIGGLAGANGAVTYYDSNGNYTGTPAPVISSITGSYATGAVSGTQSVGGLVGFNQAGTITTSHATGTITGVASIDTYWGTPNNPYDVGGLVGENDDTVTDSYANTTITAPLGSFVGGLVGNNTKTISNSYAQGSVSGEYWVGGLAGQNTGTIDLSHSNATVNGGTGPTGGLVGKNGDEYAGCGDSDCTYYALFSVPGVITNSYATGTVTGTGHAIGGLVGDNYDTITASYASGAVSGGSYVGGLAGVNESTGTIQRAYATGAVTGSSYSIGGAIGINYGAVTDAYATGAVTGTSAGDCCLGGFVADNEGSITNVYATGAVTGPNYYDAGALVGWNGGFSYVGNITHAYWNTDVANGLPGVGGDTTPSQQGLNAKGLTSAQMQVSSNFAGFDFTDTWAPADATHRPELYGVSYVVKVSAGGGTVQYGDAIASALTLHSLQNGDLASSISGLTLTGIHQGDGVGTYAVSATGASLTSSSGNAYRFIYESGNVTITPRIITVAADGATKIYGDADPALSYAVTGGTFLSGDSLSGALGRNSGSNVGTYAITLGTLAVNNPNYAINYQGADFTITPATLTYTANTATRTYGAADPSFSGSVSGFVNGDTYNSAVTGTLSFGTTAVAASGAGSYAINGSGLSAANYVFVQDLNNASALTIDKAQLTFTANAASRTYNASNGTLTGTVTGYVLNQTQANVFNSVSWSSTAGTTTDVGNYLITGNGSFKTGMSANYTIVQALSNNAALTITPKQLTWSVSANGTATYGTLGTLGTVTLTGVVSADSTKVKGVTGLFDAQGNLVTYLVGTDAGAYTQKAASLTAGTGGDKSMDYVLAATGTTRTFTINPKSVTYITAGASGTYGVVSSLGSVTLNGVISADLGLVTGTEGLFSGSTAVPYVFNTAAATYTEKVTGLTGSKAGNYSIAASGNTTGSYVINKAVLTYSTADAGGTYGTLGSLGAVTLSGLVDNDGSSITGTEALYSGANPVTYIAKTTVGGYQEKVTGISGTGVANYTLATSGNTIGTFTVSPLAITVTATGGQHKTYGDADPANYAYSITNGALVSGDSLTGALTRDAGENAGNYAITQGNLAATSNYALIYAGATFVINPIALTVTADPGQHKTYGDTDPASYTYQITHGSLINGDTLSGALARDLGEDANTYAITQGSLASQNYALTYVGATFVINPMALTVTADPGQHKTYGDADPASYTYQITHGSLVNGDSLSGALTRDVGENVGNYAISLGSLAATSNYSLTYAGATFVINPAALTITANNRSKTYGDTTSFAGTEFSALGLVNGDSVSTVNLASGGAVATAAVTGSPYAIVASNAAGSGLSNYTIVYNPGALTVTQRALTVTAANATAVYGATLPAFTLISSGLVNGDTLSGAAASTSTGHVGTFAITQGSVAASANYALTFRAGTLTITPANLVIAANDSTASSVAAANPTARYIGLVNGDASTAITGQQYGLFPVTGVSYTIVPFGASSPDYSIVFASGVLTIVPNQPSQIGLAIPPQTGTASGSLTIGGQTFTFSNAATSAISGATDAGDGGILLFPVGIPGQLSGFASLVLSDYSNATGEGDRLGTQ